MAGAAAPSVAQLLAALDAPQPLPTPALLAFAACHAAYLPGELVAGLKERLKADSAAAVLAALSVLHCISLSCSAQAREQLATSKVLKHLERLLNRPPQPGVEAGAAQLLLDWAFLFGAEELGRRAFHALTNTSKHRELVQGMSASDVAVMLREDARAGVPRFAAAVRGLDFAQRFAGPLSGAGAPGSVLAQLARAAVAASYSGSSAAAAAAAAASRNTFAAWSERVRLDPKAAAQRVLDSRPQVEAEIAALESAQAACLEAANALAKQREAQPQPQPQPQQQPQQHRPGQELPPELAGLRRQLDRAYLLACKVAEWREMAEVLVRQQGLPDTSMRELLQLADCVNAALDEWQSAAGTELFWLLAVDTAALTDAAALRRLFAAATGATEGEAGAAPGGAQQAGAAGAAAAAAAAAATSEAAAATATGGARAPSRSRLRPSSRSYLDLLTGDALLPAGLSSSNPFVSSPAAQLVPAAAAVPAASSQQQQQQQQQQQMPVSSAAQQQAQLPRAGSAASSGAGTAAHRTGSAAAAAGDTGSSRAGGPGPGSCNFVNPFAGLDAAALSGLQLGSRSSSSGTGSGAAVAPPAQPQPPTQAAQPGAHGAQLPLQQQVAALFAAHGASNGLASLQAGVLQLLGSQQAAWEARLVQLQAAHQAEVLELKATAVRRFRELAASQQPSTPAALQDGS